FDSPAYGFPPGYFIEPTVGALAIAPFIVGAVAVISRQVTKHSEVRAVLGAMLVSGAAILLFLGGTRFTPHRYEVDFLPLAALAAVTTCGILIAGMTGLPRIVLIFVLTLAVLYSLVANLALGIAGPYDEMLRNRPARYLRIARWFSPFDRFRPVLK